MSDYQSDVESEVEEHYEVEQVLDHRVRRGRLQYYVKWACQAPSSWEYAQRLEFAPMALWQYYEIIYGTRVMPIDLTRE